MAATCFGPSGIEDADPAAFVAADAATAGPFGGLPAPALSGEPVDGSRQALGQMRIGIENGLLMVFGPEGDPVPPRVFAAAAAARPQTQLALPDGAMAPASRVAAVLEAQTLGRLGAAERGDAWILAMLRGDGEAERESDQRHTGHDTREAEVAVERQSSIIADAGTDGPFERAGESCVPERDATPPSPQDDAAPPRAAFDQASSDPAPVRPAAPGEAAPEAPEIEPDLEAAAPDDAGLDLDVLADRLAADHRRIAPGAVGAGQADAVSAAGTPQPDVDPDSMLLVVIRGVPEGARLSTGVRDDDGSWLISPLDLSTVTITLASEVSPADAEPAVDRELSITGIAFTENGDLVALCESVPLADYLADPDGAGSGGDEVAPAQDGGAEPDDDGGVPGPRGIPLRLEPQAWSARSFDALVIRDLPVGARLSVGAYDPAIDGWVLRPQDLGGLAILPPPGLRGDCTLTLMGIALDQGGSNAARILARLPVRLG